MEMYFSLVIFYYKRSQIGNQIPLSVLQKDHFPGTFPTLSFSLNAVVVL